MIFTFWWNGSKFDISQFGSEEVIRLSDDYLINRSRIETITESIANTPHMRFKVSLLSHMIQYDEFFPLIFFLALFNGVALLLYFYFSHSYIVWIVSSVLSFFFFFTYLHRVHDSYDSSERSRPKINIPELVDLQVNKEFAKLELIRQRKCLKLTIKGYQRILERQD